MGRVAPPARPFPLWLSRWFAPSLSDIFFIAILSGLFLVGSGGWTSLLLDGDCGWHIRTGDFILQTGAVPRSDIFSFTKPGEPWFAWEWLSDVVFALLHGATGLKGVVLLAGVLIALFATVLLRQALAAGASLLAALPLTLLAVGASTIHHLARPHLFTLVLLPASLWMIQRDRVLPSRAVWLLVPLTALWTNLHGGFLALVACLAMLSVGSCVEAVWGAAAGWPAARRYAILTLACAGASLLNPYGTALHVHIAGYLRSTWIRDVVQEFQSPNFRSEALLQFELLLFLALGTVAWFLRRRRVVEVLWIVFWAHSALGSVRHVPLFVAVVVPLAAVELSRPWQCYAQRAARDSVAGALAGLEADRTPLFLRTSIWPALMVAGLAVISAPVKWPTDFPEAKFPAAMVRDFGTLIEGSRVLTSDQWADYLVYHGYPRQRVFIDGRSDFYGEILGREYVAVSSARYDWARILDAHGVEMVLAPPGWALASVLKMQTGWEVLRDDRQAILFCRTSRIPTSHADSGPRAIPYPSSNSHLNH